MKALLLHCKNYQIKIGQLANRPQNIQPETVEHTEQAAQDCVVALITVEAGDTEAQAKQLSIDIGQMTDDVGHKKVVIFPFAHLSNNLADSQTVIRMLETIVEALKPDHDVMRGHFGSHKAFLLDVHGHPGNARFREYQSGVE